MIDVINKQFGHWTVVAIAEKRNFRTYVKARCDCGREFEVRLTRMRHGHSSCCKHCRKLIHGGAITGSFTAEYLTWQGMKQRCCTTNTNSDMWKKYASRGIRVCDQWKDSFATFLEDMGPKPTPRHTIDRYPNQLGNYEPGNCRWATYEEQFANKTDNRLVTHEGVTLPVFQWAKRVGIKASVIYGRLRAGWSDEDALTTPVGASRAQYGINDPDPFGPELF